LSVPTSWRSGLYYAQFTSYTGSVTSVAFTVKALSGQQSKILALLPAATVTAYNPFGGKSLYPNLETNAIQSPQVSFERPGATWRGPESSTWYTIDEEVCFARWAESQSSILGQVDYGMNVDLQADPALLTSYKLVVLIGHDEYWSDTMRQTIAAFTANGGNVAFLTGNTAYWRVTFGPSPMTGAPNQTMYSQKLAADLYSNTATPEEQMTGSSTRFGSIKDNNYSTPNPSTPYQVYNQHWVLAGTAMQGSNAQLAVGKLFGAATDLNSYPLYDGWGMIGYEVDGYPVDPSRFPGVVPWNGPANFVNVASGLQNWGGAAQIGYATVGAWQQPYYAAVSSPNRGWTISTGSIFWTRCLWNWYGPTGGMNIERWNVAQQITTNILLTLGTNA
jgi:hypothetical protein